MKNLFKARWMTSLIFLILLFVITGIAAPGFLTYDNIITCFNTATMYTLLAVGIAFVIMTGEIDVSIGATLGLTAGMTGLIAQQDGSIPKMLLLCLVTGAAIGLVNGVGVSYFGVPSLIFTLGTNSVVRGLIYIMSGGRTIENFGGAISSYGNKTVFAGITLYPERACRATRQPDNRKDPAHRPRASRRAPCRPAARRCCRTRRR